MNGADNAAPLDEALGKGCGGVGATVVGRMKAVQLDDQHRAEWKFDTVQLAWREIADRAEAVG